MAAACMSMEGSKRASSLLAIGVLVVVMGLAHVQEADGAAAVEVLNLSLVPVNVTAHVSDVLVGSVVAHANAKVSLPLSTSVNAPVNLTITNLLDNASVSALVSANATTALLVVTPADLPVVTPLLLARVNVALYSTVYSTLAASL